MDISGKQNTFISLFAGTGGSSLGYHWAGYKELLAVDFDAHAVECFKLNFPDVPIWHKSVTDITGKQILDRCNIKWGELDVLDGSPPCQGFSTSGQRKVRDPRNDLFMQYCRLIDELGPKVFVMENVSGMAKGVMKGRFIEIITQLKSMNYIVKAKQMNAKYYGVPQSRQRIIFIGVRKDLGKVPVFPEPSSKLVTVAQAFAGIKDVGHVPPRTPTRSNKWADETRAGCSHPRHFSILKLHPHKPANTIPKSVAVNGAAQVLHPTFKRICTINEVKALCSFPQDWKLTGSFTEQWARLGNAVMPKFMQAIAEVIQCRILETKQS